MPSRYSLHIGVSNYDGTSETASPKDLANAAKDASSMFQYCKFIEFFHKSVLLLNEQVDMGTVLDSLYYFSQICRPGDLFVLSYAGHGTTVRGDVERFPTLTRTYRENLLRAHGEPGTLMYDKKDKKWTLDSAADNAWLINKTDLFFDNLLTLLIKCFDPGVKILSINDSCQNASMIDTHNLPLSENAIKELENLCLASAWAAKSSSNKTKIQNIFVKLRQVNKQKIKQGVIIMSSVWEFDFARDSGYLNKDNGLYTSNLLKVLLNESPRDYFDLHDRVHTRVKKELQDHYNSITNFVEKFCNARPNAFNNAQLQQLRNGTMSNQDFYAMVEKYLDKADRLTHLPASLTGGARYSKIEQLFNYKWEHYKQKTINLLSPYMNEDLANQFTPGFSDLKPFSVS